ncbi:MAG: type II toxin-antitoxin system VapC family toxin [Oceanipulchritudo sp.]
MSHCLDTNTVIYYLKGSYPGLAARLRSVPPRRIVVPEIVRAELLYGVAKSRDTERNRQRVEAFLAPLTLLPFAGAAVEHYADIRADLERRGELIGPNDLIVAATCRAHGATLVSRNTGEFSRVTGLQVVDWTNA